MPTSVKCPTCGKPVVWDAAKSPWRPFCCERCRLIDLGQWASNRYVIEGRPASGEELAEELSKSRRR